MQNLHIPQKINHIIDPKPLGFGWCEFYRILLNKRDTLLNPLNYNNKFIITNPPYLARNKSQDKSIFDKYKTNDLYKCFIQSIINNNCNGGILIIPLNFFSSIRKSDIDLRKHFLKIYDIIGKEIATLVNERLNPGTYEVQFSINQSSGYQLPSGIYFYKLTAGNYSEVKNMVLVK